MIKAIGFFYSREDGKSPIELFQHRATPSKKHNVEFKVEPFDGDIIAEIGHEWLNALGVVEELKMKNKLWEFNAQVKKCGATIYRHPLGDDWLVVLNRQEPTIEQIEEKVVRGEKVTHHFRHKAFHAKGIKTVRRRGEHE